MTTFQQYKSFDELVVGSEKYTKPLDINNLPMFSNEEMYIEFYKLRTTYGERSLIQSYLGDKIAEVFFGNKSMHYLIHVIKTDFIESKYDRLNLLIGAFWDLKYHTQKQGILNLALRRIIQSSDKSFAVLLTPSVKFFLINILIVFGADSTIIQDNDIADFANNKISPTLFGQRGHEMVKRGEEINKMLKFHLCNDVSNIISSFIQYEYVKIDTNSKIIKTCVVM